jgi:hypothetical protein
MRKVDMKVSLPRRTIYGLFVSLFLASCGLRGSDAVHVAQGGIGGTGIISLGTITAVGSITVNGVKFDTHNAAVFVGGKQRGVGDRAVLDNLEVGNVVRVEGTLESGGVSGAAARVVYRDSVVGPVESTSDTDRKTKVIVVLGQTVVIDDRAVLKHTTLEAISPNNVLEVCGLVDDTGAIRATYVSKIADHFNSGLQVKAMGKVGELDPASRTFQISGLTVDYSDADMAHLPGGEPSDGMPVKVMGTLAAIGGKLRLTKIVFDHDLGTGDAEWVELEGFVTHFYSVSDFTVGNQQVRIDQNTRFEGGRRQDVFPGVKLEIEGRLQNSILVAEAVLFRK